MPVGMPMTCREVQDRVPELAPETVRRYLSAAVSVGWLRNQGDRYAAVYVREPDACPGKARTADQERV